MSINFYVVGNLVQINGLFTVVETGELIDPTVVTAEIRLPDETIVDISADVFKIGTGAYSVQYEGTMNGLHQYRMAGTGAAIAAEEASFELQTEFS